MNNLKYRWILNIIIVVILATIGIQSYWNYKNYLTNKQQLINDVQISLDNAVDAYYSSIAENTTYKFSFNEGDINENVIVNNDTIYDRIFQDINLTQQDSILDSLRINEIEHVAIFQTVDKDTVLISDNGITTTEEWIGDRKILKAIHSTGIDSLNKKDFELLTAKVMLRISNDTINIMQINDLLKDELQRKNISINYNLLALNKNKKIKQINSTIKDETDLSVLSKSSFLPLGSTLELHFTNATETVLKRIFLGILISTLLVLAVVACLFYLLKIIKHQKELAEVKNDLISNITHEFKTPIASISVALESIKDFNANEDKVRTKRYLEISTNQLSKLNVMVEKLLDTATLDSDKLSLNKEKIDLMPLINGVVEKYQISIENKNLNFKSSLKTAELFIDVFHFENALNNVIDNAIKYGGDIISVELNKINDAFEISVCDNGYCLTKAHKEKLFDKFYRVPKGNTHNVKGFGIGLYYTKKIIEKHNGSIQLELNEFETVFKITLPNE